MMNANSAELTFRSKGEKSKYQVRFWSEPEVYNRFQQEVQKNGFVIREVYEDFMIWFIKKSEQGEIKIEGR